MATYAEHWNITFDNLLGNSVAFEIHQKNYSGGVSDDYFKLGANGIIQVTDVDDQDVFAALRYMTTEFELLSESGLIEWFNLIKTNPDYDTYIVKTDHDSSAIIAYVNSENLSSPYKEVPFLTEFEAFEGFHILKNTGLTDSNGSEFTDYVSLLDVICAILNKLPNKDNNIRFACNLYETNHNTSVCVFAQTYVQAESFYKDGELKDCLTVLEDILTVFNCTICQSDGYWWIIHVPEMVNTSITYYDYDLTGALITSSTFNPRVSLTSNAVARGLRKGYINGTQQIDVIPGYRNIIIETNREFKKSVLPYMFFENIYLQTIATNSIPNTVQKYVPEGWRYRGTATLNTHFIQDKYNYNDDGKDYYSLFMNIDAGENHIDSMISERINIITPRNAGEKYQLNINFNMRFIYNEENNDDVSALMRIDVKRERTGSVETIEKRMYAKRTFDNHQISLNIDYAFGVNEKIYIKIYNPVKLKIGDTYYSNPSVIYGVLVKNIETEYLWYDSDIDQYKPFEADSEIKQVNSNIFNRSEYKKELAYGDIIGSDFKTYMSSFVFKNCIYYLSGSDYLKTSSWDYDSKSLDATIQEALLHDCVYQYSEDTYLINADIMGAGFKPYNIIYDSVIEKLLLPLNTELNLKYSQLSGELMELKTSAIEDADYLADEADDAILDELGNEILVNF